MKEYLLDRELKKSGHYYPSTFQIDGISKVCSARIKQYISSHSGGNSFVIEKYGGDYLKRSHFWEDDRIQELGRGIDNKYLSWTRAIKWKDEDSGFDENYCGGDNYDDSSNSEEEPKDRYRLLRLITLLEQRLDDPVPYQRESWKENNSFYENINDILKVNGIGYEYCPKNEIFVPFVEIPLQATLVNPTHSLLEEFFFIEPFTNKEVTPLQSLIAAYKAVKENRNADALLRCRDAIKSFAQKFKIDETPGLNKKIQAFEKGFYDLTVSLCNIGAHVGEQEQANFVSTEDINSTLAMTTIHYTHALLFYKAKKYLNFHDKEERSKNVPIDEDKILF